MNNATVGAISLLAHRGTIGFMDLTGVIVAAFIIVFLVCLTAKHIVMSGEKNAGRKN